MRLPLIHFCESEMGGGTPIDFCESVVGEGTSNWFPPNKSPDVNLGPDSVPQ